MRKFGVFVALIVLSTLIAGVYGALHDQVTYTICPEYFTVFKFKQFQFQDWGMQSPRLTTALIGFLATWWVGFGIGIFQALVGLTHRTAGAMFRIVFRAVLITLGTALLFGIIGGLYGWATLDDSVSCFPFEIADCISFRIVGTIHNFGYAGGEIGGVLGLVYQIIVRKKKSS